MAARAGSKTSLALAYTGSQCNIRTEEAVFCQLIVTKIKSFLLCSSLAFLPGKQKNVYREESCNKLSPQLQKQWPTQANFPATQSWYLRLFNQRWEKARGCGVGFFSQRKHFSRFQNGPEFWQQCLPTDTRYELLNYLWRLREPCHAWLTSQLF